MPKREDDYWASQRENLRYCSKHKRYYRYDLGCQLCQLESLAAKELHKDSPQLQRCPKCKRQSLFWNGSTSLYECLNPKCRRRFTEHELRGVKVEQQEVRELLKCPRCGQGMLFLNASTLRYECLNKRCQQTYSESEYGNYMQSETQTTPNTLKRWIEAFQGISKRTYRSRKDRSRGISHRRVGILNSFMKRIMRARWLRSLKQSTIKLLLCLIAMALFVFLVWTGYFLFQHKENPIWGESPIIGAVAFICSLIMLAVNAKILRSYPHKWRAPSFKLVLFSILVVVVVCAFGGIEPLATYKDDLIEHFKTGVTEWQEEQEEKREQSRVAVEQGILDQVNKVREQNGLHKISRNNYMDSLALEHSKYMASVGDVNHVGFDSRADKILYRLGAFYVGENVAMGYGNAEAFVKGWMESSGHRENIMDPAYRRTGIGYYNDYATQIFCD